MNAQRVHTTVMEMQLAQIPTVALPVLVILATMAMGWLVLVTISLCSFPFSHHCSFPS